MSQVLRRVLYLADGLSTGGAERQLALLATTLPSEWEPRVWSLEDGPFAGSLRGAGVPLEIRPRARRRDLAPFLSLWSLLARRRPAIVHSWGWLCSALAAPICRLLRIPMVDGTIRVGWVIREHVLRARVTLALADRVVANSQAGLRAWEIPASKGRVIYNGFDPARLPLTERRRRDDGPFTVAMAARMSPVKDFESFIDAARLLTSRGDTRSWRFLAIGSGPARTTLMERASNLMESGVMIFQEPGLEVLPYLREADVGVLMTNPALGQEACSNSILEYMACGLPVVCSESGGNRELVLEGETGFVVPPLGAEELADTLARLRAEPDVATRMGASGRERIGREFTVQAMVQKTVDVYAELVARA